MFFIVGMPRSGTTFLAERLARLPGVAVSRETHFFAHRWRRWQDVEPTDGEAVADYLRAVVGADAFRYGPVSEELIGRVVRTVRDEPDATATFVLEALLRELHPDALTIGEKTPQHLEWLSVPLAEDPATRCVVLVRDPRAVTVSLRRVPWGNDDHGVNAGRWAAYAEETRRLAGEAPGRVHVLRYEDLLADPDHAIGRVARFLGLDGSTADAEPAAASTFDPQDEPWKAGATRPADPSRAHRWRDELGIRSAWTVGRIAHDAAGPLGYDLPTGRLLTLLPGGRAALRRGLQERDRRLERIRGIADGVTRSHSGANGASVATLRPPGDA